MTNQRSYLNLGCGRIVYPGERAAHHVMIDDNIFAYPYWVNADRNPAPGVDCVVDLFRYPWPWEDNSFDGAIAAHLIEHIPHEIRLTSEARRGTLVEPYTKRHAELENMQDGWFCWWSELHRVLTPGAIVHVISPYGTSDGALIDPSHTRYILIDTFTHSMKPDPDAPFAYETGGLNFELRHVQPGVTKEFAHLLTNEALIADAMFKYRNVVAEIYVKLECVK